MSFSRACLAIFLLGVAVTAGCGESKRMHPDSSLGGDEDEPDTGITGGGGTSTGGTPGMTMAGASGSLGGASGTVADAGSAPVDATKPAADGASGSTAGDGSSGPFAADFHSIYTDIFLKKCGPGCHLTGEPGLFLMKNEQDAYMHLVNEP